MKDPKTTAKETAQRRGLTKTPPTYGDTESNTTVGPALSEPTLAFALGRNIHDMWALTAVAFGTSRTRTFAGQPTEEQVLTFVGDHLAGYFDRAVAMVKETKR